MSSQLTMQLLRASELKLRASLLIASTLVFAAISVLSPGVGLAQTSGRGLWQLRYDPTNNRAQLSFEDYDERYGHHGMTSFGVDPAQLQGLSRAQLVDQDGPVSFRLVRDAGTFSFQGRMSRGGGNGSFTFTPDSRFASELSKRGYERPSAEQQFQLALHDMGYAVIDELRAQGYSRPSVDDLVTMGMHGARYDYVHGMGALGLRVRDTDRLVELRDHGVTPAYVT